jgi:predicted transport protein
VLDQRVLGTLEDEEEEVVDRSYWEKRGTKETVEMADRLLEIVRSFDPELELKYNKFYIGLARSGRPFNFVVFRPQKQAVRMEPRLSRSDEIEERLEAAGLDVMDYHARTGRYRIRLAKGDIEAHDEFLRELLYQAYQQFGS